MSTSLDNSGDNDTPSATTKQSAAAAFSLELLLLCLYQFFGYSDHIPLELIHSLAAGETHRKQLVYVSAVKSNDDTHVDADHDLSSINKLTYAAVKKSYEIIETFQKVMAYEEEVEVMKTMGIGDVEDLYPIASIALQENLPETFGDTAVARGKDGGGTDGVGNGGEDSGGGLPMHTENQPVHSRKKRPRESDRGRNEQFTTLVNASIRDLNTHLEAQFKSYLDELREIDRHKDKEFTTQFKSYLDELREIDRRRDKQFMTLVNAISALSNGPLPPCVVSRIGL
ncbi:hypothetical protein LWI29_034149 [Acer saccharum]|uniref:Uncharacterized protein n=1 Tax=Acer saccharum TaxID=4024 RepID=A0AA39TAR9_ACESA|nr:hypothetical protein LWI29_034149 [Acer saccharum]